MALQKKRKKKPFDKFQVTEKLLILCVGACGQLWPCITRLQSSQVWLTSAGGGVAGFNPDQPQTSAAHRKHELTGAQFMRNQVIRRKVNSQTKLLL